MWVTRTYYYLPSSGSRLPCSSLFPLPVPDSPHFPSSSSRLSWSALSLSVLDCPGLSSSGSRLSWSFWSHILLVFLVPDSPGLFRFQTLLSLFRFKTLLVFLGSRRSWIVYGGSRLGSTFFLDLDTPRSDPNIAYPSGDSNPDLPEYMG
jgi:hypothetical protein